MQSYLSSGTCLVSTTLFPCPAVLDSLNYTGSRAQPALFPSFCLCSSCPQSGKTLTYPLLPLLLELPLKSQLTHCFLLLILLPSCSLIKQIIAEHMLDFKRCVNAKARITNKTGAFCFLELRIWWGILLVAHTIMN